MALKIIYLLKANVYSNSHQQFLKSASQIWLFCPLLVTTGPAGNFTNPEIHLSDNQKKQTFTIRYRLFLSKTCIGLLFCCSLQVMPSTFNKSLKYIQTIWLKKYVLDSLVFKIVLFCLLFFSYIGITILVDFFT